MTAPLEFPANLVSVRSESVHGNYIVFRSAAGDEFMAPCTNDQLRQVCAMLVKGAKDVKVKIVVEEP